MRMVNWHWGSSRKNASTRTMSLASAVSVSSPNARLDPAEGNSALIWSANCSSVSAISALNIARTAYFSLQQHDPVDQRLCGRRTARNVDVDRHDAVAAAHDRIGIMVIAAAIGAGAHGNNVARLRHLVVDL